jgi:hypothetical protein
MPETPKQPVEPQSAEFMDHALDAIEVIDLESEELGEFDALAICAC